MSSTRISIGQRLYRLRAKLKVVVVVFVAFKTVSMYLHNKRKKSNDKVLLVIKARMGDIMTVLSQIQESYSDFLVRDPEGASLASELPKLVEKIAQDIMKTSKVCDHYSREHIIGTSHLHPANCMWSYNAEGTDDTIFGNSERLGHTIDLEDSSMEVFWKLLCTMQRRFDTLDRKMEIRHQQLLEVHHHECKSPSGVFAHAHDFKIQNATFIAAGRDCSISYYNHLREALDDINMQAFDPQALAG
ncbi:hypothetical protein FB446DRAFT_787736 [Lentinula raphanica]|nr:hypothetical protein FB446DRAFT_787736 [Lentinula raphanica]